MTWQQLPPPAYAPARGPQAPTWLVVLVVVLGIVVIGDTILLLRLMDALGGLMALQDLFD